MNIMIIISSADISMFAIVIPLMSIAASIMAYVYRSIRKQEAESARLSNIRESAKLRKYLAVEADKYFNK